jgi:hypothetical protein
MQQGYSQITAGKKQEIRENSSTNPEMNRHFFPLAGSGNGLHQESENAIWQK